MPDNASSFNLFDIPACVLYLLGGIILAGLAVDMALVFRFGSRHARHHTTALPLKLSPWTWQETLPILLVLLLLRAFLLLSVTAIQRVGWMAHATLVNVAIVVDTLFFHFAGLFLIIFALRKMKLAWHHAFGLSLHDFPRQTAYAITFYVGVMPVVFFASFIYAAFLTDVGYPLNASDTQEVVSIFTQANYPLWLKLYMGIVAVTLAPLVEELLFRGILLPLLARYMNSAWAILLVSAMFAMLHCHVPSLAPLFVIAVAFSYAYLYSGSILVPVIMHALFNAVGITTSLMMSKQLSSGLLF
jgi:membrane protease YdiL (CAAX protease family)